MKIEILEYYPHPADQKKHLHNGTLRIRLPEFKISLLGVSSVQLLSGKWVFSVPSKRSDDHRKNKIIRYPLVSFDDRSAMKTLFAELKTKAPSFIEKWLESKKQQQQQKEQISVAEWRDPPAIKSKKTK
jgi:hypothetical protein